MRNDNGAKLVDKSDITFTTKNGNCFNTAADLLAESKADVYMVQELASLEEEYWNCLLYTSPSPRD